MISNSSHISDSDLSSQRKSDRTFVTPTDKEIKEILRLQQLQNQLMKSVYGTTPQIPTLPNHRKQSTVKSTNSGDGSQSYKKDQISQVTEKEESDLSGDENYVDYSAEQARHEHKKAQFD